MTVQSPDPGMAFIAVAMLLLAFWENIHLPAVVISHLSVWDFLPEKYMTGLVQLHVRSGRRSPEDMNNTLSYKAIVPISFAVCALAGNVAGLLVLTVPLFFVPDALLYLLMKRRNRSVLKPLPDTIDLIMLCIESGLALDSAIQRVIQKQPDGGPLVEELETLDHHILLGVSRERAYKELFLRTGVDELKQFGSALTQSTKHGLGLGTLLRSFTELLRSRACMRAEKNANKIPVWMTFPMCFLILPALLMLLAGPAIIQNQQLMGGMGDSVNHTVEASVRTLD